jgi:hypothetical protein
MLTRPPKPDIQYGPARKPKRYTAYKELTPLPLLRKRTYRAWSSPAYALLPATRPKRS